MCRGGWKTDHVMKRVYRNTITDEQTRQNSKVIDFFNRNFENLDSNLDSNSEKSSV